MILLLQADVGTAEAVDRNDSARDRMVLEAVRRVDGLSRLCVCRSSRRDEVR